eukprot:TRINITY_DN9554_c0_g1_i3.p1 TRINITY_DN9554_c0_g1~~TRINITY_DN9554_c0_g1_i3.p1  ORF type:complete len:278 (-),score=19.30 TRINITY_DN9554_c0_g1_i3:980-1813(-)
MNIAINDVDLSSRGRRESEISRRKSSTDQNKLSTLVAYVVDENDSLTQIAYRHHMRYCAGSYRSLPYLKRVNGLASDGLYPGQVLKVLKRPGLEFDGQIEEVVPSGDTSRAQARGEAPSTAAIPEDLTSNFADTLRLERRRGRYLSTNEEIKRNSSTSLKGSKEEVIKMELERLAEDGCNYTLPCCALTRMGNPIKGVLELTPEFILFDQAGHDIVPLSTHQIGIQYVWGFNDNDCVFPSRGHLLLLDPQRLPDTLHASYCLYLELCDQLRLRGGHY